MLNSQITFQVVYFAILSKHFALGGLVHFATIYIIFCVILDWMSYLFWGSVPWPPQFQDWLLESTLGWSQGLTFSFWYIPCVA